ncbi:hypothetical protein B0H16DRAFT_102945 [Mycena metata]|uniref:Uncharacterized protein n=1 Tax=Mycena metata TaxID=1033252 RepID=A0AAD7MXT0_9AGAR|nr:hypothetical protein B0H16DRAFT_102945 [Mycena metata]
MREERETSKRRRSVRARHKGRGGVVSDEGRMGARVWGAGNGQIGYFVVVVVVIVVLSEVGGRRERPKGITAQTSIPSSLSSLPSSSSSSTSCNAFFAAAFRPLLATFTPFSGLPPEADRFARLPRSLFSSPASRSTSIPIPIPSPSPIPISCSSSSSPSGIGASIPTCPHPPPPIPKSPSIPASAEDALVVCDDESPSDGGEALPEDPRKPLSCSSSSRLRAPCAETSCCRYLRGKALVSYRFRLNVGEGNARRRLVYWRDKYA